MLELRELTQEDKEAFLLGLKKWNKEDLTWYSFEYKNGISYEQMLLRLQKNSQGLALEKEHVPSTMLYGFVDGHIVGRVAIRHALNDYLLKYGGNVGYAVVPEFRKRGFATEMLKQALIVCKKLGLNKILLTCADDNVPSYKIIEKFGAILENKVYDEKEKRITRRYWIALD
jgi:predicted acetyltransferase